MKPLFILRSSLLICLGLLPAYGTDYSSTASGNWDGSIWNPAGSPMTGTTDNVLIGPGHNVIWNGINVGLPDSGDLGIAGGHSITINGGTLAQLPVGNWVRIGQGDSGTLNIKDGAFVFTNGTGTTVNAPTLQVGMNGGTGNVNVGDGTGGIMTAKLDFRYLLDGVTENSVGNDMNLGGSGGGVGHVIVKGDGYLLTDIRTPGGTSDPKVRIGQSATALGQSTLIVQDGGEFEANGTVEVAANPPDGANRSNGSLTLTGENSFMDHRHGMLQVGLNGDGVMLIENNAIYTKYNDDQNRQDVFVGTNAGSTGLLTLQTGGKIFLSDGGDVGDFRVGYNGTGVMNINDGSVYSRSAGNWDWIGQGSTGNGTVNVNAGGLFQTSAGSNVTIGLDGGSIGLLKVDGGTVDLQNDGGAQLRLGQNGNGTLRQISGSINAMGITGSENDGTSLVELQGGTITLRSYLFLGGAGTGSTGAGTSTFNQSGGTLTLNGSAAIGLAPGHTGTLNMTGGTFNHLGSDFSVGESGAGSVTIGTGATLNDSSPDGILFVGRNDGSSGTLLVNGTLTRTSVLTGIRVGNGNKDAAENSTGTGTLGGSGAISLATGTGVTIGSHGTLSGGTTTTVGTLTITGDLTFVAGGTLSANFDSAGNVDRVNVNGAVNLTGAKLTGTWAGGTSPTGAASRYWLIVNDGTDAITGTFANTVATSANSAQAPGAAAFITLGGQEFGIYYSANQAANALTGGNDLLLVALSGSSQPTGDQIQKAFLGTNATTGGPNLPVASVQGTNLVFTYNRVEAATATYTGAVEYSTTLAADSWTTATAGMTVVTGTGANRTVTVTIPAGSGIPREFARLKITSN